MNRMFWSLLTILIVCSFSVTVFAGEESEYDDLFSMSLEELTKIPVVVSGARQKQKATETAVPITVITYEDIHYSGVTSLPELLKFTPGIDFLRADRNRYSIGIRGLHDIHSERIQTLIDGRIADSPVFGGAEWFRYPFILEDVKQVEVVRGPAAAAWGANAINGMINIITKEPEETQGWLVSTQWNHFGDNYNQVRWGHKIDQLAWRISAEYDHQESSEDAVDDDHFTSRDWGRTTKVDMRSSYKPCEDVKWSFGAGYSNVETGDYEFAGLSRRGYDNRFETFRTYVKVDRDFDDGSSGYLQWYANRDRSRDWPVMNEWNVWENVFEGQYNLAPTETHTTTFGASFRMVHINSHSPLATDYVLLGEPYDLQNGGGYFTDRWTLTDRWTIETQGRLEWDSETELDWAGRAAALYALDEQKHHVMRFAAARAFRTPQVGLEEVTARRIFTGAFYYTNLNTDGQNEDLQNEKTWSLEVGYTGILNDYATLKVNTYYQHYDDMICVVAGTGPMSAFGAAYPYMDNAIDSKMYGGEVELELKKDNLGSVGFWYAYNHFQPEMRHGVRAHHAPQNKFGINTRWFVQQGTTLNMNYRYADFTPYDYGGNTTALPTNDAANAMNNFDLTLAQQLGSSELMIGVHNMFSRQDDYMMDRGTLSPHKTPGRIYFARWQMRF